MANPKVRPHLSFYPEDSGPRLSEARQGRRWLHELPNDQMSQMARIDNQDYFIYEPAMLRDGTCCIPIRWFVRNQKLYAQCWQMATVNNEACSGWRVVQSSGYEVPENAFMKNFVLLKSDAASCYGLPAPTDILGLFPSPIDSLLVLILDAELFNPIDSTSSHWTFTDPNIGNKWRAMAQGSRVLAFPIWMYCDNTSGNLSKKWNEHNSFLFTPAGLPREQSQKEFNIHFLSTSNIAPPLEMLDGIVEQLELVGFLVHRLRH